MVVVGYLWPCQGYGLRGGALLGFHGQGVPDRRFCADGAHRRLVPSEAQGPHWIRGGQAYVAALTRWSRKPPTTRGSHLGRATSDNL